MVDIRIALSRLSHRLHPGNIVVSMIACFEMSGEGMEVTGLPFEAASRDPSVDSRHLLRANGSHTCIIKYSDRESLSFNRRKGRKARKEKVCVDEWQIPNKRPRQVWKI